MLIYKCWYKYIGLSLPLSNSPLSYTLTKAIYNAYFFSLYNGILTFVGYSKPNLFLMNYLTYSLTGIKGNSFLKVLIQMMNIMAWLKFELAY